MVYTPDRPKAKDGVQVIVHTADLQGNRADVSDNAADVGVKFISPTLRDPRFTVLGAEYKVASQA